MINSLLLVIDGGGVYGYVGVNAMIIALVGSSFLAFLYFWRKGQLDMDEEAKYHPLKDDSEVSSDKRSP